MLLESGAFEPDAATQELNAGRVVGLPLDPAQPLPLATTHLRYFGGTTNHWAGFCRPFTRLDFERRPWIARSGWPIGYDDLAQYYEQARSLVGLGPQPWDAGYWGTQPTFAPPLLMGDPVTSVVTRARPARFGPLYRDELVASRSVRVYIWSNVTNIAVSPNSQEVDHVACRTPYVGRC